MEPIPNSISLLSKEGKSAGLDHAGQASFIQSRHDVCRARAVAYYSPEKTQPIEERLIEETILLHEVKHFGEAAHTIRHWLRGGQVFVPRDDGNSLMWVDCLHTLVAKVDGRLVPFEVRQHLVQRKHTEVHHSQVPADLDSFAKQLLAECSLPELIKESQGYADILQEVTGQLKGGAAISLIVWHRNVLKTKESANRDIMPDEFNSCEIGALRALGKIEKKGALKKDAILHMGDPPAGSLKGQKSLCGQHMKAINGAKRTMLQQLQFLCAAVQVSGAKLIVSERAGLADLVALAGGIAECQFISRAARLGNERLTEVYEAGCGMGHNVVFNDGPNGNEELMEIACSKAMQEKEDLRAELRKYSTKGLAGIQQATTSTTKSCVKK